MLLTNIELRHDPAVKEYVKDEVVLVEFATEDGELMSLEGPNRFCRGDAIIKAANGNRWVVSRTRVEQKYQPIGKP